MATGGAWGASECDAMASTARVRRNRRDGAAAGGGPVLPEELILWDILVRVPAKELLRCRAVCRSWRRHTSDGAFLLAHHLRQPSLPLVSSNAGDPARPRASVYAFDLRRSPAVRLPVLGFTGHNAIRGFSIHASCDGLLILSLADSSRFFICNPATRQWRALPELAGSDAASLYPHRGEYRVLYWKLADNKRNFVYSILTLSSSSQEHRCIGQPVVVSPAMKNVDLLLVHALEHTPVLLHDCLHWYIGFQGIVLLVFDTVLESFRVMRSPLANLSAASLLEMRDGTLGIGYVHPATMTARVWVLQDYKTEEWSLKYRIKLPMAEMRRHVTEHWSFSADIVSGNGDVLVDGRDPVHLFHCDSKGKLLEKWPGVTLGIFRICFRESLVRHAFFQRNDDSRAKVPCFFRGL
ncbi:F-box protein At5g49610 [Brachypodium distachyon]|uniref:F-box domain-containing protein n=1 Tax=Brachypodium distachyon TaxID=15368 RepID=I1HB75_BRADI|nr:F-box protein At5g49610 [Brachypodium distachyon]KQK02312.2 hypothetical protein BRADI_2g00760v3 [Brachypodium distachyon]|eukprot:XP_014753603.1 F-box protein At5g49610 [Brachypodium distachyon]